MTKKKSNESSFTRLLGWTVLLALVFSAGMITGQRLLRHDSMPPLVSLSSEAQASQDVQATAPRTPLKTTFSFYEHLTNTSEEEEATDEPKSGENSEQAAVQPQTVESETGADLAPQSPSQQGAQAQVAVAEPTNDEGVSPESQTEPLEDELAAPQKPAQEADAPDPVEGVGSRTESAPENKPEAEGVENPEAKSLVARVAAAFEDESEAPTTESDAVATYTIQVGNHSSKAAAVRELSRLRAMKIDAHMITVEVGERRLYRVRVGKFTTDEAARADLDELSSRDISGMVVPL